MVCASRSCNNITMTGMYVQKHSIYTGWSGMAAVWVHQVAWKTPTEFPCMKWRDHAVFASRTCPYCVVRDGMGEDIRGTQLLDFFIS